MYPILRKHNEALALGYVGTRIIEAVLFLIVIISILTRWTLSQKFIKAWAPDASSFQTLGDYLLAVRNWTYNVLSPIILGIGALMFYFLLYQSELIPRWLSIWGLIGAPLFPAAWLSLFGPTISFFSFFHWSWTKWFSRYGWSFKVSIHSNSFRVCLSGYSQSIDKRIKTIGRIIGSLFRLFYVIPMLLARKMVNSLEASLVYKEKLA